MFFVKKMSCPPGKILNPATGRCVLITGAIGRKLVAAAAGVEVEEKKPVVRRKTVKKPRVVKAVDEEKPKPAPKTETKTETCGVVNCKVGYIRPKYENLREWMKDPEHVYIARRGVVFVEGERFPKQDSVWANPFKIGKDGNREEVIAKYETYIRDRLVKEPALKEELLKLKGKCLGCWCAPEPCHGDVLLKLIEENS